MAPAERPTRSPGSDFPEGGPGHEKGAVPFWSVDVGFRYLSAMEERVCSPAAPFDKGNPDHGKFRWEHPDAILVLEDYGKGGGVADGDFEKYRCPNCGHSWWEELPN